MEIKDENELRLLICYNDYEVFNKYLKTLENEKEHIMEEMKQLSISASHFDAHNIKYDDTLYNDALNRLIESLKPLEKNTKIFYRYFNEKQENCKHEWINDGHDSSYAYWHCSKCGKECRE